MPRRIFTDSDKHHLQQLWLAGEPLPAIANVMGTTPASIANLACRLRKLGWNLPERLGGERLTAADLRERLEVARADGDARTIEILELRLSGQSRAEIARRLGISAQQVTRRMADPDRAKSRAGAWNWRGRCEVCGAATYSHTSVGDASAPNRHRQVLAPARVCDQHAREERWGHAPLTREDIIAELQAMARRLDRTPKINDLRGPDAPFGPGRVYSLFGKRGFTVALQEAGLVARKAQGQTREDEKDTHITWEQRATVLRLGGSLTFDGSTVTAGA